MSNSEFPIVGIGASAGGLDAFHSFFEHMPPDCGMAFVMILHLPSERKSMLREILTRWTTMRVLEGGDGTLVEPNCVYVPPPHAIVTFSEGHLGVQQARENDRLFRPIDSFFDSLASALREKSVGIILSGTGSDGALGLKAIKECGGLTIAQGSDGTAPQYEQMPAGAIATGAVDLIVPVHEMPGHLLRVKGRNADSAQADGDADQTEELRLQICDILRAQLGHDFSGYRSQTFLRRVERRMQVVNAATLQAYVARLQRDHDEVASLFRDLLIRVTSFFRDKDTFEALNAKVMPQLFAGKNADSAVRIWVPGCATGEEAYSLAILLREHMDKIKGVPKIQVFATDIDDSAISTARLGRYPATLLEGLSTERRERFFTFSQGSYVACKEIRDLCTFSTHNLVRDPPFSRMHLVSCRNLLIYMDAELQAKVIPIFHYALTPGGILLLGGSESVAKHGDLFVPLDKAARIFQRRDVQSPDLALNSQPAPLNSSTVAHGSQITAGVVGRTQGTHGQSNLTQLTNNRSPHPHNRGPNNEPLEELLGPLPPSKKSVEQLQSALRSISEQLLSLEEEHQTALEEVRSSNEELHSVNEEMQSTNEELGDLKGGTAVAQ